MARRGWLEKKDVINTLPVEEFLGALRAKPGAGSKVGKGGRGGKGRARGV
jgi:hypothetical protein